LFWVTFFISYKILCFLDIIHHAVCIFEVLTASSRTGSKKKCSLKLLNFGCHLLQNSLHGNIYNDPIIFTTIQKHHGSHFP
jgi:hypothetical protein